MKVLENISGCLTRLSIRACLPMLVKIKFTVLFLLILAGFIFLPFLFRNIGIALVNKPDFEQSDSTGNKSIAGLQKEIAQLERRLMQKIPRSYYLVVNSSENTFRLYKNNQLTREGICSTGSYIQLEGEGDQQWLFKTPKGEFRIQGKAVAPVWRKPDWAFVEEGMPVPSGNHSSRYEYGVLGDYALSLGDGYLIHGTLYQRFLGLPVTHGCIRMRDDDLEMIYRSLNIGSKVFIY